MSQQYLIISVSTFSIFKVVEPHMNSEYLKPNLRFIKSLFSLRPLKKLDLVAPPSGPEPPDSFDHMDIPQK